jgi:hypothetical protein
MPIAELELEVSTSFFVIGFLSDAFNWKYVKTTSFVC